VSDPKLQGEEVGLPVAGNDERHPGHLMEVLPDERVLPVWLKGGHVHQGFLGHLIRRNRPFLA
jgi:hypothetical protein